MGFSHISCWGGAHDLTFRADCQDWNTSLDVHATSLPFFKTFHSSIGETFMNTLERSVVCNDSDGEVPKSFVGYIQVFSKTQNLVKSSALVAYPVNVLFMKFSTLSRG